ncbi:MAG: cyclic nucleotide-binding domain-containing protein, partial [Myxococcota bacterium]|nr:cyclic nucleotide-binding domain-containing protein [Myxococcota bacterium]
RRATEAGNVPLAIAAIDDLRALGVGVDDHLDQVAGAFCEGSTQLEHGPAPTQLPEFEEIQPLSPFLAGPSLASKATQILQSIKREGEDALGAGSRRLAPVPLFSALPKEALRELLTAFEMTTVPAGHRVIQEGQEACAVYFVARGEFEVSRRAVEGDTKPRLVLARLGAGASFGEMALLGRLPGAASVRATRPSILLVARREVLADIAERHPAAAHELAAHCRRHLVANLGWASPVVAAIPAQERAILVERLQTRLFDKGDMLVNEGDEGQGLHLIVSGEVAVFGRDRGERVVLATLTAGETVGEVELVLCRNANAGAIAVRPTATLFLPRHEFYAIVQDQPAVLHGLYGIAVQRHTETQLALEGSSTVVDDSMLEESTLMMDRPARGPAVATRQTPPEGSTAIDPPTAVQVRSARISAWPAAARPAVEARSIPPSLRPSIHSAMPPIPSYGPTSASLFPTSIVPPKRPWATSFTIAPAVALIAVAAMFAMFVGGGLRGKQPEMVGAARGSPTSEAVVPLQPVSTATGISVETATANPVVPAAPVSTPTKPTTLPVHHQRPRVATAVEPSTTAVAIPSAVNSAVIPPAVMPRPAPSSKSVDDFGGRE